MRKALLSALLWPAILAADTSWFYDDPEFAYFKEIPTTESILKRLSSRDDLISTKVRRAMEDFLSTVYEQTSSDPKSTARVAICLHDFNESRGRPSSTTGALNLLEDNLAACVKIAGLAYNKAHPDETEANAAMAKAYKNWRDISLTYGTESIIKGLGKDPKDYMNAKDD